MPLIKKTLFAVSTEPSEHDALSTEASIIAAINAAGGPRSFRPHVRQHKYDYFAANAWLRYLADEKFSAATIDALSPDDQNKRVIELWATFGMFWQSLNLCPYSFARFRRLCEKKWGCNSYEGGGGFNGKINTPFQSGNLANVGEWRNLVHTITYYPERRGDQSRPMPDSEKWKWSPAYRTSDNWVDTRDEFYTSAGNVEFGPSDVIFGDPQSYAYENAGARPGEAGVQPNNCFAPTVEIHRIWMQRNGKLSGGYGNAINEAFANSTRFQTSAYNASSISFTQAWQKYPFEDPKTWRAGQRWNDWNIGFTVSDVADYATTERGMNRAASTDVQWVICPLRWYWEMLRGPQTLSRGPRGGTGKETFEGSMIQYLSSKTTEELIREVFQDTIERNTAMSNDTGRDLDDLGKGELFDELKRMQENKTNTDQINTYIGVAGAVLGGVLTGVAGPAGAAIAGTVTAAAKLLATIISANAFIELRRTEVFGRLCPNLDTVSIQDNDDALRDLWSQAGLPEGISRPIERPRLTLEQLNLGSMLTMDISVAMGEGRLIEHQGASLRIIGMPPSGRIEVGPSRRAATGGRWEPDGQTVYVVNLPLGGPLYVRITSPSGETRVAKTEAVATQPVDLTWANMFVEHQFEVTAFPPGGHVFVDGIESMGTWKDAAMTAWLVFMPQGNRDLRLVPPTGAAVVTSIVATGPSSVGSWTALSGVGIQQRQEAADLLAAQAAADAAAALAAAEAEKKKKYLLIAGGVGLAAAVVVGGIVLMRRKPTANPSRRRRR